MDPRQTEREADRALVHRIGELVAEEKRLRGGRSGLDADGRRRLQSLEYQLDQAWDLLRQRRAREEADDDPASARERTVDDVESYLQ